MSHRPSRAFASNDHFVIRIVFDARAMLVCALFAAALPQARAQAVPDVSGTAVIATNAARGISGVLSINETAGLGNAQANQLAIGIGSAAGAGVSSLQAAGTAAHTGDTSVRIEGGALSNLSGAAMVNQSAGSANLQRNSMAIGTLGVGIEAVSDSELSETAPKAGGLGIPAGGPG